MKILWLSHQLPYPPKGGGYQRSFNMIKEVGKKHDVDFISLAAKSALTDSFGDVKVGIDMASKEIGKYVNIVSISIIGSVNRTENAKFLALKSIFSRKTYDENYYSSEEFSIALKNKLSEVKYDLIYVDTIGLMPLLGKINSPVILNHHNIESLMLERRRLKESNIFKKIVFYIESRKMKQLEREYIGSVNANITCSELDESRLNNILNCTTYCIPNGVDTSYFRRRTEYKPKTAKGLIFIGGLGWYPNADAMKYFATSIYPEIKKEFGDIVIDIIGRGNLSELDALASRDTNFRVHGFVDDILAPMENAEAYICPIRDGGGTKLKVLDALAMGIPLIAHPIACEGIDVENGKNVLFAKTPKQYCEQLAKLKSSSELAERLSREGQILINKKYSYHIIGENINSLFKKIFNEASRAR
ncbi:glycosyltransferase family 4 protein [Reinekea marina]|uniref:Glycosyltransferase family 4 protein n=1 Tax=Reinekea marina TaxID=1310421 RepID=A0ABV7WRN5_9GAMM